jgi:transcriptional regulator GlxA family with amidase domain
MAHTVAFLVYPGFELLDVSGPASVFGQANTALNRLGRRDFYKVEIVSTVGGLMRSSSGVELQTRALSRLPPAKVDTLLIAGAEKESVVAMLDDPALRRWAPRCARAAERFGSICSGAFILASLGMLDGRRVTSHWDACGPLAQAFPSLRVDPDTLYVVDGKVWTSAGVTTGIDMALAMVSTDLGADIAGAVAQRLVLYVRRPGYQSQFSPLLRAQTNADSPFRELIDWLQTNLDRPLNVPRLAERAGLSERSFHRHFVAATGQTPARFIETLRLDAARMLLAQGLSLKAIAAQVGLSPATRLSDAFRRRFGVTPQLFRELHAAA